MSCAFPAGIKTGIARNARVQLPEKSEFSAEQVQKSMEKLLWTTPDEAASEILAGVRKCQPRIMVGKGSRRMDVLARLMPVLYRKYLG